MLGVDQLGQIGDCPDPQSYCRHELGRQRAVPEALKEQGRLNARAAGWACAAAVCQAGVFIWDTIASLLLLLENSSTKAPQPHCVASIRLSFGRPLPPPGRKNATKSLAIRSESRVEGDGDCIECHFDVHPNKVGHPTLHISSSGRSRSCLACLRSLLIHWTLSSSGCSKCSKIVGGESVPELLVAPNCIPFRQVNVLGSCPFSRNSGGKAPSRKCMTRGRFGRDQASCPRRAWSRASR
ncbi:hypothetical protein ABIC09_005845 [Bradyrhizobium sp. S3.12.5]